MKFVNFFTERGETQGTKGRRPGSSHLSLVLLPGYHFSIRISKPSPRIRSARLQRSCIRSTTWAPWDPASVAAHEVAPPDSSTPLPGAPPLIQTAKRGCPFGYPPAGGKPGAEVDRKAVIWSPTFRWADPDHLLCVGTSIACPCVRSTRSPPGRFNRVGNEFSGGKRYLPSADRIRCECRTSAACPYNKYGTCSVSHWCEPLPGSAARR